MVNLPEDVLFPLFENWLYFKDIVQLDSANCTHSFRPHFLQIVSRCTLVHVHKDEYGIDGQMWWRSNRRVKALPTLAVFQNVSDSFARYTGCSADTFANVHTLYVIQLGSSNVSNWLRRVVPLCRNVEFVCAQLLTEEDIPWIRALAKNSPHLKDLHLQFTETPEQFAYVLLDFKPSYLESVELNNVSCKDLVRTVTTAAKAEIIYLLNQVATTFINTMNQTNFDAGSDESDDEEDSASEYDEVSDFGEEGEEGEEGENSGEEEDEQGEEEI
jgi:hypothetical protein